MRLPAGRRILAIGAITLAVLVTFGGGGTYVALEVTTKPEFCTTCHIMEPYYESWKSSSHANVPCIDCHYEPGLVETFQGKFKALSQLAKYVTATQGTKPWAEVADSSCMRSGCHSEQLLQGDLQFKRVRFNHRHHLVGLRRGKKLRCTSCHSQMVQGDHLTVTTTSCILCHFRESPGSEPINDCNGCHGAPKEEIQLGPFVFRHSEYLARGVKCGDCHGDITRGTGDVPRQRCGSCHNQQAHLERYDETDFLHQHHVTDHAVQCLECHTEIQHSLPKRSDHFQGDCKTCHLQTHAAPADVYRGTGGKAVADNPGIMFLARVTCNGCHRPPYPGAPVPPGGTTHKADPLACIDCHGPGYDGMVQRWQAEIDGTTARVKERLEELYESLGQEWEDADLPEARARYAAAAHNLDMVLRDKSRGAHNLPYVRDLLARADEDARAGLTALDPSEKPRPIHVGPRVASKDNCTQLCHSGAETLPLAQAFGLPFKHGGHLLRGKLDCSDCHAAEPHGKTIVQRVDCMACHHKDEESDRCSTCHTDVNELWGRELPGGEEAPMRDLDCLACHAGLGEGHSRAAMQTACDECHDDEEKGYFERWLDSSTAPLAEVEAALASAAPELAATIRAELAALRKAGPHHNAAFVKARARELLAQLKR